MKEFERKYEMLLLNTMSVSITWIQLLQILQRKNQLQKRNQTHNLELLTRSLWMFKLDSNSSIIYLHRINEINLSI